MLRWRVHTPQNRGLSAITPMGVVNRDSDIGNEPPENHCLTRGIKNWGGYLLLIL